MPDADEVRIQLDGVGARLHTLADRHIRLARLRLDALAKKPVFSGPEGTLRERRHRLDLAESAFLGAAEKRVERERAKLSRIAASLDALSPLAVLARGYSIASLPDGTAVRSVKTLKPGMALRLRFADGTAEAAVTGGAPKRRQKSSGPDEPPEQLEIL